MGAFYTGFDYKNRKNGYFKIGETQDKTPAARLSAIRQTDSFQCLGYLLLKNETLAERRYVESYVRMMMEKTHPELTQVQNDHFTYTIDPTRKYEQAQAYAETALRYAMQCCDENKISYEIGTKVYKRG